MNLKKDVMIGTLVLSIFVFILASSGLYVQTQISSGNACGCLIPLPLFVPFLGSLGLFIGVVVYSIFHPKKESSGIDRKSFLKLFEKDERKVIEKVISNDGEFLQSDIVDGTDLSKVKVHRILKKLESKGLVDKESFGNSNKVVARGLLEKL